MWDLSSLAQKAKEAVATFENEINDSVGHIDSGVKLSNLFQETETSDDAAAEDTNEAEYFKVEEEEVSFEADTSQKNSSGDNTKLDDSTKDEGSGWDQCEDVNSLSGALSKIEELEKQMKRLREELDAAKEEIKTCRVTNLELEQQVRDLTEENMSLKMNMAVKEDAQ